MRIVVVSIVVQPVSKIILCQLMKMKLILVKIVFSPFVIIVYFVFLIIVYNVLLDIS